MSSLRRLSVGAFDERDAIRVDELSEATLKTALRPALDVVAHFPQCRLTANQIADIRQGRSVSVAKEEFGTPSGGRVAMLDSQGVLIGVGEVDGSTSSRLQPRIVFPIDVD
jgi:tRNA U55 pseudouridine synthase TruB